MNPFHEWPSGLRHCVENRKGPGSNPTRCSAGLWVLTSLRGSRWPSGRYAVINIGLVRLPPDSGSKVAVGQPSRRWKKRGIVSNLFPKWNEITFLIFSLISFEINEKIYYRFLILLSFLWIFFDRNLKIWN